jgi:hypothetical protein
VNSARHFSLGTATDARTQGVADLIADAISSLLNEQNPDGTWGGPDNLDRLISTNHVLQTLLCCGFASSDRCVKPGLDFLAGIDKEANVSFFWRGGVFLNIPGYESLVAEDIAYIWKYRTRIGAHKDYPVPFFLLKLLRFAPPTVKSRVDVAEVLNWVLSEWNEAECWYGRTSITSMALALVHDMRFRNKAHILSRSLEFLVSQYKPSSHGGAFSQNLIEDAFLVFNLCERNCLQEPQFISLLDKVPKAVDRIVASNRNGMWESTPPFGGAVQPQIYSTAIMVRALMSFYSTEYPLFASQLGAALVSRTRPKAGSGRVQLRPFWGEILPEVPDENLCFILMPFSPDSLTQIYERFVKQPLERKLGLKCVRADDIYQSTQIMRDIWNHINRARIIVAELTGRNPNVFYELGLAHVLGKRVILIAQSVDFIPFDLRSIRTIIYNNELKGYEKLAKEVVEFVKSELRSSDIERVS